VQNLSDYCELFATLGVPGDAVAATNRLAAATRRPATPVSIFRRGFPVE